MEEDANEVLSSIKHRKKIDRNSVLMQDIVWKSVTLYNQSDILCHKTLASVWRYNFTLKAINRC
jgi:hypothetical protein